MESQARNTLISSGLNTVSVLHMKSQVLSRASLSMNPNSLTRITSDSTKYATRLLSVRFVTRDKCVTLGRMSSLQLLQHRSLSKTLSQDLEAGLEASAERSQRLLTQRSLNLVMHTGPTMESGVGKKYTIQGWFTNSLVSDIELTLRSETKDQVLRRGQAKIHHHA